MNAAELIDRVNSCLLAGDTEGLGDALIALADHSPNDYEDVSRLLAPLKAEIGKVMSR